MGLTRGVTSSSTGEGRRSAVESAPWFKASEQGSSILPFATRVFIIFVIISEIQFSSWLSVRTDICDKASEEVVNFIIHNSNLLDIIIRVLSVRIGLLFKGAKWQRNATTISHFNLNISAGGSIPYVPTKLLLYDFIEHDRNVEGYG